MIDKIRITLVARPRSIDYVFAIVRNSCPSRSRHWRDRTSIENVKLAVPDLVRPSISDSKVTTVAALNVDRPAVYLQRGGEGLHRGIGLRRQIPAHQVGSTEVVIFVRIERVPMHFKRRDSYRLQAVDICPGVDIDHVHP